MILLMGERKTRITGYLPIFHIRPCFFQALTVQWKKIGKTIEIRRFFEFSRNQKSVRNGEKPLCDMRNPHVSIAVGIPRSGVRKKLIFIEEKRRSGRVIPINRLST